MKMKNFGLRGKILSGVFISAIFTFIVAIVITYNMHMLKQGQLTFTSEQSKIQRLTQIKKYVADMQGGIRSYLLSGDLKRLKPFSENEEILAKYIDESADVFVGNEQLLKTLASVKEKISEWVKVAAVTEMLAQRKLRVGFIDYKKFMEIYSSSKGHSIIEEIHNLISEQITKQEEVIASTRQHAFATTRNTILISISGLAISIIVGALFQFFITRKIYREVRTSLEDLTSIESSLNGCSSELVSSSQQLKDSSVDLSDAIGRSSSAITEISSMIEQTNTHTTESQKTSLDNYELAEEGGEKINHLNTAISSMQENSHQMTVEIKESNEKIRSIVDLINEISKKTKVINDIVFQTKLLSFNASVEAARAGEHGKGFSVVAEEIGNLATVSGNAAGEISEILTSGVGQVNTIVDGYTSRVDELFSVFDKSVQQGADIAAECQKSLETIVANSRSTKDALESISSSVEEQSVGVKSIADDTNQIDSVSKLNAKISQETGLSVGVFNDLSDKLHDTIRSMESLFLGSRKFHEAAISEDEYSSDTDESNHEDKWAA